MLSAIEFRGTKLRTVFRARASVTIQLIQTSYRRRGSWGFSYLTSLVRTVFRSSPLRAPTKRSGLLYIRDSYEDCLPLRTAFKHSG